MTFLRFVITTATCNTLLQNAAKYNKKLVLLHNEVKIHEILSSHYIMHVSEQAF